MSLKFSATVGAGRRCEAETRRILEQYTKFVYANCRVDTLFTVNGYTEVDLIAAVGDVILAVEVKNIRSIDGRAVSQFWTLEGAETGERYTALNVLVQNRIHVRALKNAWWLKNGFFPLVLPTTVVPNGCEVPEDVRAAGVLTIREFEQQLVELNGNARQPKYGYALQYFVGQDGNHIARADLARR